MSLARERTEFAPPPTPGLLRAVMFAIAVHALLLLALGLSVNWKRDSITPPVEAELWSAIPQQAAPPAPEPALPPESVKSPEPEPTKPAPPKPVVETPPPPKPDASIALERERARQLKEKQLQSEKLEQEKRAKELKAKELKAKELQAKELKEKEAREKLAREKQQELLKAQAKKPAATPDKAAKQTAEEARKLEEFRQQNLKRMAGLAGGPSGSGEATSKGTAAQTSGLSAGYAGRIRARIKPNMVYIETIVGNPTVEIEVRASPDGTILTRKVTKASGTNSWDEAVLKAIDKMVALPFDENGRVPTPLTIVYSAQDMIGR